MKHIYFISLFFVLSIPISINAQVCTGDFTLDTQAAVDQFNIDNPTCTTIDGDLILGSGDGSFMNLDGLQNITSITGDLSISAFGLSFAGLDQLISVGGSVFLSGEQPEIIAFPNLIHADQIHLSGIYTDHFNAFNALPSSMIIIQEGDIHIGVFDSFQSLQTCELISWYGADIEQCLGFNQIESIGLLEASYFSTSGDFWEFPLLSSLQSGYFSGVANAIPDCPLLTEISGYLVVAGSCQSIGFVSLESVGQLDIGDSFSTATLQSINMNSLQTIVGNFTLMNSSVSSLSSFSNLVEIGGEVFIAGNNQLTDCSIQVLCDKLTTEPENVFISGNGVGPGCNDNAEVGAGCSLNFILSQIYVDYECDGVLNNDDTPVYFPIMLNDLNAPVGIGSYLAAYMIPVDVNTTITFAPAPIPGLLPALPQTLTTGNVNQIYSGYDFGLCPDLTVHDLAVSASIGANPRPGFEQSYHFYVKNNSANLEDGTVTFDFSNMPGVSVVNSYGGNIIGNTVVYNVPNLFAFEQRYLNLRLLTSTTTPVGTIQTPIITISLDSGTDLDLSNNVYTWNQTVVSSYDPNDIAVNIEAQNFAELPSEGLTLDYTIRFQNTGTAPADFVRVTDTIEEDLNLGSIEILGASHPSQISFNENREVEWLFENIQLPDSTSDLEGSQGYVHYRIKTVPDVLIDDVIENTAAIYFDYNAPVITNTATTIFYECLEELVIIGESQACEGGSINLHLTNWGGTYSWDDFNWTFDDTVLIDSVSDVTLYYLEPGMHTVTCTAMSNYCQSDIDFAFEVFEWPDSIQITGDQEICEGESVAFTATSEWSDYIWNLMGVGIISTTDQAEVLFPDIGQHVIQVQTTNEICWTYTDVSFTVFANPEAEIQYNGQFVSGPSQYSYTWYINGELIEGLTSYSIDPWLYAVDGFTAYAVVTGPNECATTTNTVSYVGLSEAVEDLVEVYPNPMQDQTFVKLPSGNFTIELLNAIGQRIETWTNVQSSHVVHRNQLTSGTYMLKMTNEIGVVFTTTLYVR